MRVPTWAWIAGGAGALYLLVIRPRRALGSLPGSATGADNAKRGDAGKTPPPGAGSPDPWTTIGKGIDLGSKILDRTGNRSGGSSIDDGGGESFI